MYKGLRVLAMAPAYNEEAKIGKVVARIPKDLVDCILVIDDGSTDQTPEVARQEGARVISMTKVEGVGAAIRRGLEIARAENFDVAVILAGNNKDDPSEIPLLLDPIANSGYDLVVGSRYLRGGGYGGEMPFYRKMATRLHPFLLGLFCGKKLTESTNGFRAIRLSCLTDSRIRLNQEWLDGYALEVYILFKMIVCGHRHTEVPCTKIYPPKRIGNTKMRPFIDWWDILRPIFLLGFRIKS